MSRTFGWIQDGGSFLNFKRILLSIIPDTDLNTELRETLIPQYIPERFRRNEIITAITGDNCNRIPYDLLKGFGSGN